MTTVHGQRIISSNTQVKLGSCPPLLPVQVCTRGCLMDNNCLGISKCCPTSCGGSVCSSPVTTRRPTLDKIGTS